MTNTQTQPTNERPTDEVVQRIYAIKEGVDFDYVVNAGGCIWDASESATKDCLSVDPRNSPDACNELLHWLCYHPNVMYGKAPADVQVTRNGWAFVTYRSDLDLDYFIPKSGEKRRYAVVRLAAQCLGVEDD